MILCAGEALIDMIPEATLSGASGYVPHAGGAVYNTAIALGRLRAEVGLLTGMSKDRFGDLLMLGLADSGVRTELIPRFDALTTLAMVELTDGQARYRFYDENSAGQALRINHIPQIPDAVQALFIGGISLVSGPAAQTYTDLALREASTHVIMMDPNIRPNLIADPDSYRARLSKLLAVTDIIKLSDEDLDWLYPDPSSTDAKITALQAQGPQLVLLTMGGDGATAYHRYGHQAQVSAPEVTVADTVGAGDTFNAGILSYLQKHDRLRRGAIAQLDTAALTDMLSHAVKVAAVTVSRSGANPPWAHEVDG